MADRLRPLLLQPLAVIGLDLAQALAQQRPDVVEPGVDDPREALELGRQHVELLLLGVRELGQGGQTGDRAAR